MSQQEQTATFFDNISEQYSAKYERKSLFHEYFFNQRLEKATRGIDFNGKKMLDIGSGTGNLFSFINSKYPNVDFYATDISSGMLAQSPVPAQNKFQGNCYDVNLPLKKFDIISMLGVSTYMDPTETQKTFNFVKESLADDGVFIITFTNRCSFDIFFRNISRLPLRLLGFKGRVISGNFKIFTYSLMETEAVLSNFKINEIGFLNQTIFPFCLLLPRVSIAIANVIDSKISNTSLLSLFSSDFIVRARK